MTLTKLHGEALTASIAARRSLADLDMYEASLRSGPTPDWAAHPKIVAAFAKRRAELAGSDDVMEPN
jgi:hypothetical protein